MRYHALACDYDGTLAGHGRVGDEVRGALEQLKQSGRRLVLVTVMVLPSSLNKATGLTAALDQLGLSARNAGGVGDAENDHAFLAL